MHCRKKKYIYRKKNCTKAIFKGDNDIEQEYIKLILSVRM